MMTGLSKAIRGPPKSGAVYGSLNGSLGGSHAATVSVTAVSAQSSSASAEATVTITAPTAALSISPASVSVAPAGMQQLTASVANATKSNVVWKVRVIGSRSATGTNSPAGLYTVRATPPSPAIVYYHGCLGRDAGGRGGGRYYRDE